MDPLTHRDATPANGSQVDPSVAISAATGKRLVAATDVIAGSDTVHIWNRAVAGDVPIGTLISGQSAQPSIGWDGIDAHPALVATASSSACPIADRIDVRSYDPVTRAVGSATTLAPPVDGGGAQTWPRVVLGAAGDPLHAGKPIVVADQKDCATGAHRLVIAWDSPGHTIGQITDGVDEGPVHQSSLYPDVAVVDDGPGAPTRLIIAYLGAMNGNQQQDVRVRQCLVHDLVLDCSAAPTPVVETIVPPGTVVKAGTSINALAAPAIACAAGACDVVWTEASGNGRSRVFRSRSTSASGYTSWSSEIPVASSTAGSQLLPSIAMTPGGRTDVVYVNLYDDGTIDTLQTSFAGSARGRDTSLTGGNPYSPQPNAVGQRTDATEIAATTLAGYFPNYDGGPGSVSEAELAHGTTPPILAAPGATKTLGKNTTFDASAWLAFDDPDGDPATVTLDDPAHGSVAGGVYTADPTYAGSDTVTARATYGATTVTSSHTITITNQAPVLDAPAPAIVDEGGAIVTVPLHAVDPDANDAIVYSVAYAESPLNVAGRATIVGATLRLDIPAGVRAMAPLRITLRARDTTTGLPALDDYQDLSVTIRPDLATPSTVPSFHVTGSRATLSAPVTWVDPSNGCLKSEPVGCHVRRVWSFGDGTPSVTTTDLPSIDHPYPRAGRYSGQVTTWILWGGSQVASDPKPFTVPIQDDGRVIAAITPKRVVKRGKTNRQVQLVISARATGSVWISISVGGKLLNKKQVKLVAGKAVPVNINVSVKGLHSHRATIRLYGWGMVASSVPPTDVYRAIILR